MVTEDYHYRVDTLYAAAVDAINHRVLANPRPKS
jgi:hypothetical protein